MLHLRLFIAVCVLIIHSTAIVGCEETKIIPEEEPKPFDGLVKLDSIELSRAYPEDGSTIWNIHVKILYSGTKTDTVELSIVGPSGSPFEIITKSALIVLKPLQFDNWKLQVKVPSNHLTQMDFTKKFDYTIVVKRKSTFLDSKSIALGYPLPDHPRLMVRKSEIQELAARFNHSDFSSVRSTFNTQKSFNTNGIVTTDKPNEAIRQKMEALAFEYLTDTTNKVESGKQAIQLAINYLTSFGTIGTSKVSNYDDLNYTNEMIVGAAMVYDWCYKLLTQEDKIKLREAMILVCKRTEYGLPNSSNKQYLSGHYSELNPTVYLAMGIALFDEDPSFFLFAYNEQKNGFAPSRNFWAPSGTHHQGAQYIHVRHGHELLQHFMLSKLGLSPYDPAVNTITFRAMYGKIPQTTDMDGMPEGDGHNGLMMKNPQIYYLSANLSKDLHLQYLSRATLSKGLFQATRLFIYHNPLITSVEPENSLCLTKYFPSPSGMMIARTKWDINQTGYNSNAMVVLMNMKEYNAQNHTHLDGGHFSIYYKGHLALDAGIYQGSDAGNGWGKVNFNNYYSRTIAHNSLLIYDPNEPLPYVGWNVKAAARDGGQFFFNRQAWNNSQEMINAGKSSQILANDFPKTQAPAYSYLKGDLTKAYNVPAAVGAYPAKADTVRRSFVFLNFLNDAVPGALIVLDRVVSTNASFRKTWLLHTQNQPTVKGSDITSVSTRNGRNGRITAKVLIPEPSDLAIELVGGPGKEYWVENTNFGSVAQEDAGQWRVEVSPLGARKSDNFLHVLQVNDASGSQPVNEVVKAFSNDRNYIAVGISDRIVMQHLLLGENEKKIDCTLGDANVTYQVLVTDLKPGTWTIHTPSGIVQKTAETFSGTVSFTSKGGRFSLTKN